MNQSDLGTVIIRAVSLYLLGTIPPGFIAAIQGILATVINGDFGLNALVLGNLVSAIFLWTLSKPFGKFLAPTKTDFIVAPAITLKEATNALVTAFGFWLMLRTIHSIARSFYRFPLSYEEIISIIVEYFIDLFVSILLIVRFKPIITGVVLGYRTLRELGKGDYTAGDQK